MNNAQLFLMISTNPSCFPHLVSLQGLARVSLSTPHPWSLSTWPCSFKSLIDEHSSRTRSGEIIGMRITMKRQKHAPIVTWFTTSALLVSVCAGLVFNQPTAAQSHEPSQSASQRDARSRAAADYPALAKYATDLTQLALRGKLEPAQGRDADIAR